MAQLTKNCIFAYESNKFRNRPAYRWDLLALYGSCIKGGCCENRCCSQILRAQRFADLIRSEREKYELVMSGIDRQLAL